MPKFTTTGDTLKNLLKYMDICNNHTKLDFEKDKMTFVSIDPSSTCMLVGNINPAIAFDSYEAERDTIIIDVKDFDTILKRIKKNKASFEVTDMKAIIVKEGNTTWNVRSIDDDSRFPRPDLSTDNSFTLSSEKFIEELTRAMDGGDVVDIEIKEDCVILCGMSEYSTPIITRIPAEELTNLCYVNDSRSQFTKSFLEDLLKHVPSGVSIRVGVDNQYPLCITITASDNSYSINYYLAPRIEEDDL